MFNLLASLAPGVSSVDYVSMWRKLFVQCGNMDIDICAGPMWDLTSFSNKLPNLNYINSKLLTFPSYWKIFLFGQISVKAQLSLRVRVRRLKEYNCKKLCARAYFENTQYLKYYFLYKIIYQTWIHNLDITTFITTQHIKI